MREATEADDANNRLETPPLGKLQLSPDPSQPSFIKIDLFHIAINKAQQANDASMGILST